MPETNTMQAPKKNSTAKIVWSIVITFILTAIIAGGGIYLWQKSKLDVAYSKLQEQESTIQNLQAQKDSLDSRNKELQKKIDAAPANNDQQAQNQNRANDAAAAPAVAPAQANNQANNINFPVVVYSREGLLTDHPAGLAEKQLLKQKLIDPYTDYNNENSLNLVALHITVPVNVGDAYSVLGIFGSDQQYGTEEFEFGKREQNFDYWHPECMGPCPYTPAFIAKYPQIVNP